MGIKERQQREKEQRYNDIIEAAIRLFSSRGLKKVTMEEISRECEFSKGALYFYFKSKEDLAFAVMDRCYRGYIEMVDARLAGARTGLGKIEAALAGSLEFFDTRPNLVKIMGYFDYYIDYDFKASYAADPVAIGFRSMINAYREKLAGIIREGIADGSIRKDVDPAKFILVYADALLAYMQKFTIREDILDSTEPYAPRELISYMMELILHSLRPA
ncbi:MAG: TetR/AcrR family transcriptional regulator [Spirochaetota bacterium]|jgi:AcrR family transcriptional regulator